MRETVHFKKEHFKTMQLHPSFEHVRSFMNEEQLEHLEASKHAYTFLKNGEVIACAGLNTLWQGRAEAWTFFGRVSKLDFLLVFKNIKRFLALCDIPRVEASIVEGYKEGHRWIKLLGFTLEAESRPKYTPDGKNWALYARVK